jgi:hypothetical protein
MQQLIYKHTLDKNEKTRFSSLQAPEPNLVICGIV